LHPLPNHVSNRGKPGSFEVSETDRLISDREMIGIVDAKNLPEPSYIA